jgi:hypothetical protein
MITQLFPYSNIPETVDHALEFTETTSPYVILYIVTPV